MLNILNNYLWYIVTSLILISGLYFSIKIKFIHFNFQKLYHILKRPVKKGSISPWQTLMMNLAARIGVGSISGIALAVYIGGAGSIFWMWITALFASSNTFIESILGRVYNEIDHENIYKGGPSFYIEKGLKKKRLAKFYAICIILAFSVGFLCIQSNTMAIGISEITNYSKIQIGMFIALITALVIIKGVKSIAKVTDFLVPIMGLIYLIVCLIIFIINIDIIPTIISDIFLDAFKLKPAAIGIFTTFIVGIQRGIFSNEAGIGTGAIAAGVSDSKDLSEQGFIQSFGVIFDTLIIGTLSAIVVLTSNYLTLRINDPNGIEIARNAFSYHLGSFGTTSLILIIIMFAFASIITGYYYGESNLKFLKKQLTKKELIAFKIFTIIILIIGSITSSTILWSLVDIFIGILAIINIYAIVSLRKESFEIISVTK